MLIRLLLLLVGINLLGNSMAAATQFLSGSSDDQFTAVLSRSEPNLLRIEGRKIRRVVGPENVFTVTPDQATGTAYIQIGNTTRSFMTVYLIDEVGKQWRLFCQIRDVPGDVVVLKDVMPSPKRYPVEDLPLPTSSLTLIQRMVDEDDSMVAASSEIPLWSEAKFVLVGIVDDFSLVGEKFRLTNISPTTMQLDEREFYKPGVIAVAIDIPLLAPNEYTYVYVVRRAPNE
jgi:conjugal transfer pilus assembly protein TraK